MEFEVSNECRDDYTELGMADLRVIVLMIAITIDNPTDERTPLATLFPESDSGFSLLHDLAFRLKVCNGQQRQIP